jgi:nucleotide-binding universal stress UspA family protein
MKTIIAPVDFSEVSLNALSFAAELAKRAAACLIIVNVLQGESEADAAGKLKSILMDLKKKFDGLNCESIVAEGNFVNALKNIIDENMPDLVVMGTKGASGLKKILIGSNTMNLLAGTKTPMLVIPEDARFEKFVLNGKNRIILATDLDELEYERSLDILKEIAMIIVEPKIRVMNVRPKNTGLDDLQRLERRALMSYFEPEIECEHITVFSNNVISGINFYLDKNADTGLLAMMARDSGELFQKSYTKEMASQTQLPMLVLYDSAE